MCGLVALTALLVSCDDRPRGQTPENVVAAVAPAISADEVVSLRPDRRTILRPYEAGSVLIGQPGGEDAGPVTPLRVLGPDGVLRRAPFDSASIAAVLNVPEADVFVRDALPLGGGRCLVFVNGFSGKQALLGVWLYRPGDRTIVPLANAERLGQISGLGESAQLADGRLIAGDRGAWLWLSGFGQSAVVWIGMRGGDAAPPELRRVDDRLNDESGRPLVLGDASIWRTDSNDSVLWVRPDAPTAYRIRLESFIATEQPGGLPPLVVRDARGNRTTWQFTPAPQKPKTQAEALAADAKRFPLLSLAPTADATAEPRVIDRNGLRTRLGFPRYAVRFTQWCPDPTPGRVLAYDAMSGEVLRLRAE